MTRRSGCQSGGRRGPRRCPEGGGAVLRGAERVWHDLRFKDLYRRGKEFGLMNRAMGFAALAILTVIPLLVVVAAAGAASHHGLGRWVVYGMDLSGSSAGAVLQLFTAPARVLGTTSVFGALLLSVAGVSFGGSVQAGFEKIWGLSAGPWHKIWRQAVWLAGLIAYIYAAATVGTVTNGGLAETAGRVAVALVLGIAFFWWGLRFLTGGRVSYLAAMPGAVATMACLSGLRVFSALVFEPLIVSNAVSYGALGTVLIVQSWLIGVGWVLYGSQLFGRWFHDLWLQDWAHSRRDHGKNSPGGVASQGPARGLPCSAVSALLAGPALQLLGPGDVGVTSVQREQLLRLAAPAGAGGAVPGHPLLCQLGPPVSGGCRFVAVKDRAGAACCRPGQHPGRPLASHHLQVPVSPNARRARSTVHPGQGIL
jgi:membrane protein